MVYIGLYWFEWGHPGDSWSATFDSDRVTWHPTLSHSWRWMAPHHQPPRIGALLLWLISQEMSVTSLVSDLGRKRWFIHVYSSKFNWNWEDHDKSDKPDNFSVYPSLRTPSITVISAHLCYLEKVACKTKHVHSSLRYFFLGSKASFVRYWIYRLCWPSILLISQER